VLVLKIRINPDAQVTIINLHEEYRKSGAGKAEGQTVLTSAGNDLTKNHVALVSFGEGRGKLLISQL